MRTFIGICLFCALCALSAQAGEAFKCDPAGNQREMNQCAADKIDKAAADMDQLLKEKIKSLQGAANKERLRQAQEKWKKFVAASCLYEIGKEKDGGSIYPLARDGCKLRYTEQRIEQLKSYIACARAEDGCPL